MNGGPQDLTVERTHSLDLQQVKQLSWDTIPVLGSSGEGGGFEF